jgi:ribosomal protein L37AE/L43A
MKEQPIVTLTIRFGAKATPKGRKAIAAWLRKEARHLERCGRDYAPRFSARFWSSK